MLKLTDRKWKLFKLVGEYGLFKYGHGNRLKVLDRKEGNIPLVTAGAFDNGVKSMVAETIKNKKYRNAITIDMFGCVFYHDYEFICDDNIYPIYPINNKRVGLFLSTIIKKHLNNNFGIQFREYILKSLKIKLPVDRNNNPDWKFMEDYINERERDCHQNLMSKFYINVDKINMTNWSNFKIKDIFYHKIGDISKISIEKGYFPLVSCTQFNNGIIGSTNNWQFENCISVATNGICGKCFYHDYKFGASVDTMMLFNKNLNKYNAIFISTVLEKQLMSKYSYGNKNKGDKTLNEIIKLPSKNNKPDWKFMENFIKSFYIN